jgi:hypothetical protein
MKLPRRAIHALGDKRAWPRGGEFGGGFAIFLLMHSIVDVRSIVGD